MCQSGKTQWISVKSIMHICLTLHQISKLLKWFKENQVFLLSILVELWQYWALQDSTVETLLTHSWPSLLTDQYLQNHLPGKLFFNSQINSVTFLQSSTGIFQRVKSFIFQAWTFFSDMGKCYCLPLLSVSTAISILFSLLSVNASKLKYSIALACYQMSHI